ncbi:MAG: hypothetical protein AAF514_13345 [Verrucomicrobiota bacterium]
MKSALFLCFAAIFAAIFLSSCQTYPANGYNNRDPRLVQNRQYPTDPNRFYVPGQRQPQQRVKPRQKPAPRETLVKEIPPRNPANDLARTTSPNVSDPVVSIDPDPAPITSPDPIIRDDVPDLGMVEDPSPAKPPTPPLGISIPDSKGFVYSPHTSEKKKVDVRGIPKGTEVKDPYTGKTFLVP